MVVGALAVVAVTMFAVGRTSSGGASPAATPSDGGDKPGSACTFVERSAEGAATTAAAGLHAIGELFLDSSNSDRVEATLGRYVVAEQRAVVRSALAALKSKPLGSGYVSTPMLWSETPSPAGALGEVSVRLLTVDAVRDTSGAEKAGSSVSDVVLRWDGTQGFWRLVRWPANQDAAVRADLEQHGRPFCMAASA
jgi:hypothetical protein